MPLSVHFAGCQLCSGKAADKASRCWPAFRRTLRFAEDQYLRPLGLSHPPRNRSAQEAAPLVASGVPAGTLAADPSTAE